MADEDWTDPEFVTGAVHAQLEDLKPLDKVIVLWRVLEDTLNQILEGR